MPRFLYFALGVLAFNLSVLGSSIPTDQRSTASSGVTLKPISIRNYESAMGLRRRSSENFADLDLETQSQLIYGSGGADGGLLLANMTLYAADGLQMILMESFDGLTSAVDCKGDDGTMSLTFNSQQAFDYALKTWNFINDIDDSKFLLIANHEGCGPDDERKPYYINQIVEDTASLTTHLAAQPASWSDVAGTYDLDFGKAFPYQNSQRVKARSLLGGIENGLKDVGNGIKNVGNDIAGAVTGTIDYTKSVTFGVNAGQQNKRENIYTDSKGRLKLDCINCFIQGSFEITGHVSTKQFSLKELTLKASPQNFLASLELEATVTSTDKPDSLQYSKELLSAPIPGAGITVGSFFKLGAVLSYDVGVSASFAGSATVDFGLEAGLPNSALLIADIKNPDKSSAAGFSGGSITPSFDVKALSASITVGAYSQPKLSFGIEMLEIGNVDIALGLKLPEISATLKAEYNESGVCTHNSGASKTGVELSSQINVGLDLDINAKFGSAADGLKPSWSKKLFGISEPLVSKCYPIKIPGLDSSPHMTSAPPLSIAALKTAQPAPPILTVPISNPIHTVSLADGVSMAPIVGTAVSSGYLRLSIPSNLPSTKAGTFPSFNASHEVPYPTGSSYPTGILYPTGLSYGTGIPYPTGSSRGVMPVLNPSGTVLSSVRASNLLSTAASNHPSIAPTISGTGSRYNANSTSAYPVLPSASGKLPIVPSGTSPIIPTSRISLSIFKHLATAPSGFSTTSLKPTTQEQTAPYPTFNSAAPTERTPTASGITSKSKLQPPVASTGLPLVPTKRCTEKRQFGKRMVVCEA